MMIVKAVSRIFIKPSEYGQESRFDRAFVTVVATDIGHVGQFRWRRCLGVSLQCLSVRQTEH